MRIRRTGIWSRGEGKIMKDEDEVKIEWVRIQDEEYR